MDETRPTKRVRFQEAARDIDAKGLGSPPDSSSNQRIPPSERDICTWTLTHEATAPCFVRDIFSMRESVSKEPPLSFYWLGHIPCRLVLFIGVVVGIDVREKQTVYTIDDSTQVIDCMLRHPQPFDKMNEKERAAAWLEWRNLPQPLPPLPPPLPVTAIGYPVEVIGKVIHMHDTRKIAAKSIKACESTNDQWKHVKNVVELHKSKYAVPKPFKIPAGADLNKGPPLKRPLPMPCSPLTHSAPYKPSDFVTSGSTDPPTFRHPSQLRTAELTDKTFQWYLGHYLHHASKDAPRWDTREWVQKQDQTLEGFTFSQAVTISHLRRIPELALLASRVVRAEISRREEEKAGQTRKSLNTRFLPNSARAKMKRLFMWAALQLYEEGSIVLYDRPLAPLAMLASIPPLDPAITSAARPSAPHNGLLSISLFSSHDAASAKSVISDDDAYLSDPPPYEEDEAYVPVTAALLAEPVREIMCARGIKGKSTRVSGEDILKDLKRLDNRWARIRLQPVEQAMQLIVLD